MRRNGRGKRGGEPQTLGQLELAVLRCVWRRKHATVREVWSDIERRRHVAYTTVATVMTRLTEKALLRQARNGNVYEYAATRSEERVIGSVLDATVKRLLGGRPALLLAALVRHKARLTPDDVVTLESLGKDIRRR
ncbi:MAG: BlaI/MecI/CopY family transcriptional regulator [Candidatus Eremiobacteraeota bacterium]|nr:BlaI/MecI/CopY family transcriptional regulator [Candidatus Eremiobacteraeota bacterium]MBC5826474.1 BlaI/MecI/CopY family transcriptional regulator [Candidatus Eremiobacteraeota bacterium]